METNNTNAVPEKLATDLHIDWTAIADVFGIKTTLALAQAIKNLSGNIEIKPKEEEIPILEKIKYTSSYICWIPILGNMAKNYGIELTPALLEAIETLVNKLDNFPGDSGELDKFVKELIAFGHGTQITDLFEKIKSQNTNVVDKKPKKTDNEKYRVSIKYPDGTEVRIK